DIGNHSAPKDRVHRGSDCCTFQEGDGAGLRDLRPRTPDASRVRDCGGTVDGSYHRGYSYQLPKAVTISSARIDLVDWIGGDVRIPVEARRVVIISVERIHGDKPAGFRKHPPGPLVLEAEVWIVRFARKGVRLRVSPCMPEELTEGGVAVAVSEVARLIRETADGIEAIGMVEARCPAGGAVRPHEADQVVAADVKGLQVASIVCVG